MNLIIQHQGDHRWHQRNMATLRFSLIQSSQVVQFIYYGHYFGQLCGHDPNRASRENRVSRFAVTIIPVLPLSVLLPFLQLAAFFFYFSYWSHWSIAHIGVVRYFLLCGLCSINMWFSTLENYRLVVLNLGIPGGDFKNINAWVSVPESLISSVWVVWADELPPSIPHIHLLGAHMNQV